MIPRVIMMNDNGDIINDDDGTQQQQGNATSTSTSTASFNLLDRHINYISTDAEQRDKANNDSTVIKNATGSPKRSLLTYNDRTLYYLQLLLLFLFLFFF